LSSTALPGPVPASLPRKLLAWLPTLLWLCMLAFFSTDIFSAEHTGSVLQKIIHALLGNISPQLFQQVHFLVRKTAHFMSYGFLGALAFFSWRATLPARARWSLRWSSLALFLTLLAASGDELHQTFIASRTGNFHDVLLDMAGAIFFQIALAATILRHGPGSEGPRE
jgi:VanZ family protein